MSLLNRSHITYVLIVWMMMMMPPSWAERSCLRSAIPSFSRHVCPGSNLPLAYGQNVVCPVCKKLHLLGAEGKEKDGKGNKQPISIDRLNGMLQNNLTLISVLDWKQQKEAQQNTLNVPSAGNSRRSSVTSRTSGGGCSRSPSPCPCQVTISGCTYCDNEHSWICLLCDEKLCNDCITGHLEMKGEHQIYNLAEESKKLEKFSRIASNDLPEQDLTSSRQRVLIRTFLSDPNLRLSLDLGEKICQPSFTPVVQMSPRPPPLPPRIRLAVDTYCCLFVFSSLTDKHTRVVIFVFSTQLVIICHKFRDMLYLSLVQPSSHARSTK